MATVIESKFANKQQVKQLLKFHFELVYGCNLRCVGCPISTLLPKVKRISVEDFRRCMLNVDVEEIKLLRLFNFGETLLHDNLSGILKEIRRLPQRFHQVEISTNGQIAHWEDLEEAFKTGVLTQLAVSCDGDGTPESYEQLRPPAKWDKLMYFLKRVKFLRDQHCPHMELVTRTICTEPGQQAVWQNVLEPIGWKPEFRDWLQLPESELTQGKKTSETGVCHFMKESNRLYVDWDGTVIPCCAHPSAGNWGSLKTHKFSEIAFGQARMKMYQLMHNDRTDMSVCGSCGIA